MWADKAKITHDDNLLARFPWFGFGWFGSERKLEIGHICQLLSRLKMKLEMKLERGVYDPRSKNNESARGRREWLERMRYAQAVEDGMVRKAELALSNDVGQHERKEE